MLQVFAMNFIKQECVEDYLAIAKVLVEKTNALDKGCIKYELCRDINDPLHFVMHEEWEDKNSLDMHMKSKHFLDLAPKTREFTSKPSELYLVETLF